MIVAVDGPAASGKGTLARRIANRFDLAFLDTGLLYRAVGHKVLAKGGNPAIVETATAAARELALSDLEDPALAEALRSDEVSKAASQVAALAEVRAALLGLQRRFAHHPPGRKKGAVLDGRDIGTIICPSADVKIFVTASPEVRAERRHKELIARGETIIYARVLEDLKERDARDSARAAAPLKPAPDAYVLDTSALDADQAFDVAVNLILTRIGSRLT
ncbi:MAG TPA: (d)CMP kinase [Alphaproteobacteria bacterium]|nr:(d)CMP kinase [Alphaproteobacteria bacterium]